MRWLALLALVGCGWRPLPEDQVCREVGYAIAARTKGCSGDEELAFARWEQFQDAYACLPIDERDAPQLLNCAATIRKLSCERAEANGDDLALWLETSPACRHVVEEAP